MLKIPKSVAGLILMLGFSASMTKADTQNAEQLKQTQAQLMKAIKANQVTHVEQHLHQLAEINFFIDRHSPLSLAAAQGNTDIVSRLLQHGAKPGLITPSSATALMHAAFKGHLPVVEQLLEAGADVRIEHNNGYEAFDFALEGPYRDIMRRLIARLGLQANGQLHPLVAFALNKKSSLPTNKALSKDDHSFASLALMTTVINRDEKKLAQLIEYGVSLNWHNVTGYAALPIAARLDQKAMLELLLEHGADINLGNNGNDEASALNQAARSANAPLLQWLIDHGADVNKANARGYTALHLATYRQCLKCVSLLLAQGASPTMKAEQKHTAISIAKASNNKALIQLFDEHLKAQSAVDAAINKIEQAALTNAELKRLSERQINTYSSNGKTLLLSAIEHQPDMVVDLIEAGADVNQRYLNELKATPLMAAVSRDQLVTVRQLLVKGANINAKDAMGDPAINWASYYGYKEIVQTLLKYGADDRIKSIHGDAMHIALRRGHTELATLTAQHRRILWSSNQAKLAFQLIEAKDYSKLNSIAKDHHTREFRDPVSHTLLHFAVQNECIACVEILLNNGFNTEQQNMIGFTPLMTALQRGNRAIVELLIKQGANINHQANRKGMKLTPLMVAAISGSNELVDTLLTHHSQLNTQDIMGNTAALWAAGEGHLQLANQLLKAGSDPEIKNNYGFSLNQALAALATNKGEQ